MSFNKGVFCGTVLASVLFVFFQNLREAQNLVSEGEIVCDVWIPDAPGCEVVFDDDDAWADKIEPNPIAFQELNFQTYKEGFGDQPGQLVHVRKYDAVYRLFRGKMGVGAQVSHRALPFGATPAHFIYEGDGVVKWEFEPSLGFESWFSLSLCAVIVGGICGSILGIILMTVSDILRTLLAAKKR